MTGTGGGGGGTPSGPSYDDQFDDATLDKTRWNAIVRDTPAQYSAGRRRARRSPLSPGDIYTGDTNPPPNNFILQDASHAGADWVIETKINGYTINGGYAQGGLMAYVNGDNYVKFDAITDPDNTRINRIELRSEVAGAIQNPQENANLHRGAGSGPIWLRLTKAGTNYSGEYSFDGVAWTRVPGRRRSRTRWPRRTSASSGSARRRPASATRCRSTTSSSTGPTRAAASECDRPR